MRREPLAARRGGWRTPACGAAIAAAALASYWRTFQVPALFDDNASIADNPTIRHLRTAFFPPSYATVGGRPVLNLSLAVNYALGGERVWGYHALNLAIHVLAGLALFGIVRRTLVRRAANSADAVALSAALLWTLHPLQTASVTYLIQRAESLMGLFYLGTLYFFIRGAESAGSRKNTWFVLSVAACLLGMGTKEVMVSAPLVVLLYDRTFLAGGFAEALRRRRAVHAGLASTWIALPFLVYSTHGRGGTAGFASGVSVWSYALTQFPAITHYLRLSLWPRPLVFDYGTALAPHSARIVPYALFIACLLAATAWALARRPIAGFLGACFFAVLAPSSSIVPVASEPVAEHRMYLALAPVVLAAVLGLQRGLGRAALPACLALGAALGAATFERNKAYAGDELIWSDTVAKMPDNERAHNNLGIALDAEGRSAEAISQFETVLRLKPDLAEAHSNLADTLAKMPGRLGDAIAQYEEAVRLKPDYAPARINLANALDDEGRTREAVEQGEAAVRLRPYSAEAHSNLGSALSKEPARLADAVSECETALRLKPELAEAHSNLGSALARLPGRLPEAIAQCEEAVRLKPGDARAHNNLGSVLAKSPGRLGDAAAEFEAAVRLDPGMAEARNNLGNVLDAEGKSGEAIAQFEAALRIRPDSAEAHSNLGNALAKTPGGLDPAIAQYQEALRIRPDYVWALNNLASVLNAEGRTVEAVARYEEALRLRPDLAGIHLNLALALLKLPDRTDEAVGQLRQALRLEPGNAIARQTLRRMGYAPQ
jgi:tetratricopeptide (TPR) repeat protein